MKPILIPALAALFIAAAPVDASPLETDWVSQDAKWMIHFDVQRIVNTKLGLLLLNNADTFDIDLLDIRQGIAETGIDPLADFHGVTLYGAENPEEDAVIIITMNDKIDDLLAVIREEQPPGFSETESAGYSLVSWKDGDELRIAHVRKMADERRMVAIANCKAALLTALRVIDDEMDSVADAGASDFPTDFDKGTLICASASSPPWKGDDDDPASRVIRQARSLAFDITEVGDEGDEARLRIRATAASEQHAKNMADVIGGFVALGKLMAEEPEPPMKRVADLACAVTIEHSGKTVTITIQGRTLDLLGGIHVLTGNHLSAADLNDIARLHHLPLE